MSANGPPLGRTEGRCISTSAGGPQSHPFLSFLSTSSTHAHPLVTLSSTTPWRYLARLCPKLSCISHLWECECPMMHACVYLSMHAIVCDVWVSGFQSDHASPLCSTTRWPWTEPKPDGGLSLSPWPAGVCWPAENGLKPYPSRSLLSPSHLHLFHKLQTIKHTNWPTDGLTEAIWSIHVQWQEVTIKELSQQLHSGMDRLTEGGKEMKGRGWSKWWGEREEGWRNMAQNKLIRGKREEYCSIDWKSRGALKLENYVDRQIDRPGLNSFLCDDCSKQSLLLY